MLWFEGDFQGMTPEGARTALISASKFRKSIRDYTTLILFLVSFEREGIAALGV